MRIAVVIAGAVLVVVGLILLIISGNAISAIDACPSGFFSTYTCAPFLGATSKQASLANAYSLLEIGILLAVVGALVILFGKVAKSN